MSLTVTNRMRNLYLLFFSVMSLSLSAQSVQEIAKNHVISNPKDFSSNVNSADDLLVTNMHSDDQSKLTHIYMNQMHNGMKIYNAIVNVSLDEDGNVFHSGNRSVIHAKVPEASPSLTVVSAVQRAATFYNQNENGQTAITTQDNGPSQRTVLSNSNIANSDITGELMYVHQDGNLVLTWSVAYLKSDDNFWWDTKVNAMDGSIVDQTPWTVECMLGHDDDAEDHSSHSHKLLEPSKNSDTVLKTNTASVINGDYFVVPIPNESPNHGGLATVNSPWLDNVDPAAHPFDWHNDGATVHFTTRGNNVWAVEDMDADNNQAAGFSPTSTLSPTGQEYNFVPDFTMAPAAYQEAAITNLFYWNNLTHDILYHYGFNEECGNFQETNATGLGLGSDAVQADAIDGDMIIGPNNATFATPPDGQNPRMSMFPFTNQPSTLPLNTTFSGSIALTTGGITEVFANIPWTAANDGPLVLAIDNAGTNEACGTPAPGDISNAAAISGNVALIDRGSCAFTEKVVNAEAAGAISVVICNNVATAPIAMQGTPPSPITIPSIMISMADCNTIKAALPGVSISFDDTIPIVTGPDKTSDYDNGIIVHEYGHGWSIRLTGGAANSGCLSGDDQMGEGWSDYLGIIFTMKPGDTGPMARGVGTYAIGQPVTGGGIRPAPYSTDFAVNSLTYQETAAGTLSIPHGVGTVWATMLWDMTWDLIGVYGMGTNLYESNIGAPGFGGQNLALRLVTEALKLQPCTPGFVDGRDAILAADQALYGGMHSCLIWNAFARRGLGASAIQGSVADNSDNVEAFDLPDAMIEKVTTATGIVTDGTSVTWDINVELFACAGAAGGVTVTDVVDPSLTITSVVCPAPAVANTAGNTITITHPGFGANSGSFTCNVITTVNTMTTLSPTQLLVDDVEGGNAGWTINEITGAGAGPWAIVNTASNSPANSWFIDNTNGPDKTVALESPVLVFGASPFLNFFHQYDTEGGWDGGFVQVSTDGGSSWNDVTAEDFCIGGYNSVLGTNMNTDIAGKDAWSGDSGGFVQSLVNLGAYANTNARVRFVFGQDDNTNSVGWWIDDIEIVNDKYTIIDNMACALPDGGDEMCSSAAICVEIVACQAGILGLSATGTDATCATGSDGTATASATGGVAPYTYLWNVNQTTATAIGLSAGTYTATVTDANGCSETVSVTIGALPDVCPLDPSIPTMGEWGLMILGLLIMICSIVAIRERNEALSMS